MLFVSQSAPMQNLRMAIDGANITPICHIASPLAAAEALLTEEERDLGVALVDIGAGTTDVILYKRDKPRFATIVPYAGESVTHDMMVGMRLTRQSAESVKIEHGCALEGAIDVSEMVQIPGIGGRQPRDVKKRFIATIIEARLEEILELARHRVEEAGGNLSNDAFPAGVVLTGGTALTPQIIYLAERVLNMPVRLGFPGDKNPVPDGMNTPDYHVALGTINMHIQRQQLIERVEMHHGKMARTWNRIKNWVIKRL